MTKAITATFDKKVDADMALNSLYGRGYSTSDISVITREDTVHVEHPALEGVKEATATGGVVGGVLGLLAGIGILALPGIGSIFIAGPITVALGLTGALGTTASGALTGALVGGLLGAFKELGIDEVKAKILENKVREGSILLLINKLATDADDQIEDVLKKHVAENIFELDIE